MHSFCLIVSLCCVVLASNTAHAKNIVHIQIDDLRTEIGAYNPNHVIHTPNIDKLAKKGVTFDRAYAQQALCNPSRASYMTGRYPDTTQVWNLIDNWRVKHQVRAESASSDANVRSPFSARRAANIRPFLAPRFARR